MSSKTCSRRLQDIFARRLLDVLENKKLLYWRSTVDVLKTFLGDVLKMSWKPTSLCWESATDAFKTASKRAIQKKTDVKLYDPAITLSTQDNPKLLEQLKSGFKVTIN